MIQVRSGIANSSLRGTGKWICEACRNSAGRTRRNFILSTRPLALRPKPWTAAPSHTASSTNSTRYYSWSSPRREAQRQARKAILPDGPARTRFAPSPTGDLHIGGLRTALYSYLLAKRTGGQFLVRIEDTDQKRLVEGAEERLLDNLRWAGLEWDEGPQTGGPYGPYKQSERNEIYQTHAKELLDKGAAYRCFCTPQTAGEKKAAYVTSGCYQDCSARPIDESREKAESGTESFTVRLNQDASKKKRKYPDLVYGTITPLKRSPTSSVSAESETGAEAADSVLVKSDGTPTYHFANVVDDHLMKITHVIRGSEWMASTPLHYDLYDAFGWTPPKFAHVSLLVDKSGAKLSKRNQEVVMDVNSMKAEIPPEALCNFLVLLGWSNPTTDDVMNMRELIEVFDLKFTKGNTIVQMGKLAYLSKHHVLRRGKEAISTGSIEPIRELVEKVHSIVLRRIPEFEQRFKTHDEQFTYVANALLAGSKVFKDFDSWVEQNSYLFNFNPDNVPAPSEFYDKNNTISHAEVSRFVNSLIQDFDFQQPYREPKFPVPPAPEKNDGDKVLVPKDIEQSLNKIAAALDHELWLHISRESKVLADAPFTDQLTDTMAYIQHLHGVEAQSEEATGVEDRRKKFRIAVNVYLRQKLAYGRPGPNVASTMALLGYDECCARLGIQPGKKGW